MALNHLELEEFDDFSIECSITKLKGIDNNGFGLVWAYKKADNNTKYSTFRITGDGHYFFGKYDFEWVNEFKWTKSPHIFHIKFRDVVQNYHLTKHLIEIKRYYYAPTSKIGCAGNPSPCHDPRQ